MKAMCGTTDSHKKKLYAHQHLSFSRVNCLLKGDMLLLRTVAPWLLLAVLGQQVSLSSGARSKTRGADRTVIPGPGRAQRGGTEGAATGRGKFSLKNGMQCRWGGRVTGDPVRLSVKCESPVTGIPDMKCEYTARPRSCPGYVSDPTGFWKQVARAFKRLHGSVCRDERALVKAGMCKRAPPDAHFKLDILSSVVSAESGGAEPTPPAHPTSAGPTACTRAADHRKKAEEYCSSSWASVCSFLFSMLQGNDC